MRVSDAFASRPMRTTLIGSVVVGWAGVVIGAALERWFLMAAGATVLAIVSLILTKALLEMGSVVRQLPGLSKSVSAADRMLRRTMADLDDLQTRAQGLGEDIASQRRDLEGLRTDNAALHRSLGGLRVEVDSIPDRIAELGRRHDETNAVSSSLASAIDEVRAEVVELGAAHDTTRAALGATRALTEKLAGRARSQVIDEDRLQAASANNVGSPLLSIAIPSFDRPVALAELLAGIASEIDSCPPGLVEVCITDDASTDPEAVETALAFAEGHPYASLRIQPSNIGIERNVLAAGESCRGEYLLLVGNDDVLVPGALATMLDDLKSTGAPVLLYSKRRINLDGSPRADVAGSTPIELATGAAHLFDSLLTAAREQGLISTFGFVGPIVVRRTPFMAVDPGPYLDLTMYAPLCVMIEAFAGEAVFYRNVATILHRTPTQSQKHAESLGRREEAFMSGGSARLARYFGTSLAAALQRLIDRSALEPGTIATMPERLMTNISLVDWIARNRTLDPAMDVHLDARVVADADRFFAELAAISSPGGSR